jgi:hypothetical protein
MFSNWQQEKAIVALVDAAQAVSDKLAAAKPHVIDSHAATVQFWAAFHLSEGRNLYDLAQWQPTAIARFAAAADAKITALRKQRMYDSSDGLAIWLHTARAVAEPRIAPAVRDIWRHLSQAGTNADAMAKDLLQDAGLPIDHIRQVPKGFHGKD